MNAPRFRVRPGALLCAISLLLTAARFGPGKAAAQDAPPVTREQAVAAALANSPDLAGFSLEIVAADARTAQGALRPNPELELELANFGWDLPGARRSETTVGVSQLLETGGKRQARARRAGAEADVLRRDYEGARLSVIADAGRTFTTLLGAQKRLELLREAHRTAELLASAVAARADAGAVSPIEETRAKVALAAAAADVERGGRAVEEARRELAAVMGETAPAFGGASGELPEEPPPSDLETLSEGLARNPDIARWDSETASREAALAAERSLAVPDVTLSAAYRRLQEERENTFVAALSVPLPLFHRNQGAIREASARLSKTGQERRAAAVRMRARLAQRHAAMEAAGREAKLLKRDALPGAQGAYEAVEEGYRLGKFRYLDLLDARKALVDTKLRYVDALVEMNMAAADVERLAAQSARRGATAPAQR